MSCADCFLSQRHRSFEVAFFLVLCVTQRFFLRKALVRDIFPQRISERDWVERWRDIADIKFGELGERVENLPELRNELGNLCRRQLEPGIFCYGFDQRFVNLHWLRVQGMVYKVLQKRGMRKIINNQDSLMGEVKIMTIKLVEKKEIDWGRVNNFKIAVGGVQEAAKAIATVLSDLSIPDNNFSDAGVASLERKFELLKDTCSAAKSEGKQAMKSIRRALH